MFPFIPSQFLQPDVREGWNFLNFSQNCHFIKIYQKSAQPVSERTTIECRKGKQVEILWHRKTKRSWHKCCFCYLLSFNDIISECFLGENFKNRTIETFIQGIYLSKSPDGVPLAEHAFIIKLYDFQSLLPSLNRFALTSLFFLRNMRWFLSETGCTCWHQKNCQQIIQANYGDRLIALETLPKVERGKEKSSKMKRVFVFHDRLSINY